MKTRKILGRRGRITIPYEIRMKIGMEAGDVLSFEEEGTDTVIITREAVCSDCPDSDKPMLEKPYNEESLLDFLDGLSQTEQRAALVHLSIKWAGKDRKR